MFPKRLNDFDHEEHLNQHVRPLYPSALIQPSLVSFVIICSHHLAVSMKGYSVRCGVGLCVCQYVESLGAVYTG